MGLRHVVATLLLILLAPPRVSITVVPAALLVNGTVRITCTVPRHPDNRWLTIAVPGYVSSTRQLDGDAEKVTHVMYVDHVPCEATEVVCEVVDTLGRVYRTARPITVAGCD